MLVNGGRVFATWLTAPTVRLAVEVSDGGLCRFGYAEDGEAMKFIDPLFQSVKGRWIGAKVGLFCLTADGRGGWADFDYFRFRAIGQIERRGQAGLTGRCGRRRVLLVLDRTDRKEGGVHVRLQHQ